MGALVLPAPSGLVCLTAVADATANTTLTTMAAAEDYYATSARFTTIVDLTRFTQSRLIVRRLATAGATGAFVSLKGTLTLPATTFNPAGGWIELTNVLIATQNNVADSDWVNIPQSIKAAYVYLALTMQAGDGVASPVVGGVQAFLR